MPVLEFELIEPYNKGDVKVQMFELRGVEKEGKKRFEGENTNRNSFGMICKFPSYLLKLQMAKYYEIILQLLSL